MLTGESNHDTAQSGSQVSLNLTDFKAGVMLPGNNGKMHEVEKITKQAR